MIALRRLLPEGGPEGDEALIEWLFDAHGVEDALGGPFYSHVVGMDFRDPVEMKVFREKLLDWVNAQTPAACLCYLLEDSRYIGWPQIEPYLAKMERLARKSPLVELWRCRLCEESWFVSVYNSDGDYEIQHASPNDVSEALERDFWPPHSTTTWNGDIVSAVDCPHLEAWLGEKGYESLDEWRSQNGPELGPTEQARLASHNNRDDILRSSRCACWACSARFEPDQISSWIDWPDNSGIENDGRRTAECPECGKAAVLGDASPLSIHDRSLGRLAESKGHPRKSKDGVGGLVGVLELTVTLLATVTGIWAAAHYGLGGWFMGSVVLLAWAYLLFRFRHRRSE